MATRASVAMKTGRGSCNAPIVLGPILLQDKGGGGLHCNKGRPCNEKGGVLCNIHVVLHAALSVEGCDT